MTAQDDSKNQSSVPSQLISASHSKEGEAISLKSESIENLDREIELSSEVKEVGVEKLQGTIELPPDVKKLGVTHSGSQTPVATSAVTISLPLSDDQIISGSQAPITSALKWLSVWCLKRLKSLHLALKNIHGKIVRVISN